MEIIKIKKSIIKGILINAIESFPYEMSGYLKYHKKGSAFDIMEYFATISKKHFGDEFKFSAIYENFSEKVIGRPFGGVHTHPFNINTSLYGHPSKGDITYFKKALKRNKMRRWIELIVSLKPLRGIKKPPRKSGFAISDSGLQWHGRIFMRINRKSYRAWEITTLCIKFEKSKWTPLTMDIV